MEQSNFLTSSSIMLMILFILAIGILVIIAKWRVYEKAGQPGWAVLIPFYNFYVLLEIVGKPGWWLILYLLPGTNIVVAIWATNLLSKSFGKDVAFTLGLIFLSAIFYPILGFGNAKYQGPAGQPTVTQVNV